MDLLFNDDEEAGANMAVAVVGAGVMGRGLAETIAEHGHSVVLIDISEDLLIIAREKINISLKARAILSGSKGLPVREVLDRITFTTNYGCLKYSDFVIENVCEDASIKRKVYGELSKICSTKTIFAANTSTIPIAEIGSYTDRPQKVVGLHFMNPANTKEYVELIPSEQTSEDTLTTCRGFLAKIGKKAIQVNDAPGFVSNRILMLTINEAIRTVQDGTGTVDSVDEIFVKCFGHQMGPLATADLIGLDTILFSLESLQKRFGDLKYEPIDLLRTMVNSNQLGRKSGRGFFHYS